jgi:hypothetical protein
MSKYKESGVEVDLTGLPHHRFADLPAYRSLSGQFIKECDFTWLQVAANGKLQANSLFNLELKGFGNHLIPVDHEFERLVKKVRDTLSLFSMAWIKRGKGKELQQQLPLEYNSHQILRKIYFVLLINEKNSQATALRAINNKLKNELRGISALYDCKVTLVNLSTAQIMGLPVKEFDE